MIENDFLHYICERSSVTGVAIFTYDEIDAWPTDFVTLLKDNKLLCKAEPPKTATCTGCEEYCLMEVHIFPGESDKPARAFISCDKPQDMGRIAVDMKELVQWQFTLLALAEWLTKTLKLSLSAVKSIHSKEYQIGTLSARSKKSLVALLIDNELKLSLAGHTIPLLDVLSIKKGKLNLNRRKLLSLIDQPIVKKETPQQRQQRIKNWLEEEKAKKTKNFLQVVAERENISVTRVKQILDKNITY